MDTLEKIAELRRIMKREKLSAYIISGTDPHNSEYLPAPWQQREWFSGFTGSFGTVVVTMDDAGLWTDTRYFIQAEQELENSSIKLHKLRIPGAIDYPQWLLETLPENSKVGIEASCMPVNDVRKLKRILAPKNIAITETTDLLGEIWLDRPGLPMGQISCLREEYTGENTSTKLQKVRDFIDGFHGDYILFSALDEIAWLYNIRCNDIPCNPVAISYAVVDKEKAYLFIKKGKVSQEIREKLLANGIEIHDYHHIFLFLDNIPKDSTFLIDTNTCNHAVFTHVEKTAKVVEIVSPIPLWKAIKNEIELSGFRLACQKDAVALTKFFYWIYKHVGKEKITELDAAAKLQEFRKLEPDYLFDSFETISAYGKNAALPHYSASMEHQSVLEPKGLYLVDSGAQYLHGTTDITRTMPLGDLSETERTDYTLVLKGMIDLSRLYFPKGSKGCHIDLAARMPLYMHLRNFGHGTGHGVGYFLNVHEGPQSIRPDLNGQEILPGMVTSNEPGLYRENHYGIRHENLIVCQPKAVNEFGEFYQFETITLCYFDTEPIVTSLLDKDEIRWLNEYNERVYQTTKSFLTEEERVWLREKTKPIIC